MRTASYVWQDRVLRQFPLTLDRPPDETTLTRIMHIVGKAGATAARVEVPFEAVAPADPQIWSLDSREELCVPLGRTGATRLQYFRLGRGVAQHMLIAGKTGSGKSTLFHVMVTNLALWYAPDQVELYLIDFKQGVEFKTYVTHHLPHARAIAIESDREFGLSILRRLDAEMTQRGELFRAAGVQDIGAYRQATGKTMPRTVLIVDEFQVFFAEDDKLAQDAAVLLEQLVPPGTGVWHPRGPGLADAGRRLRPGTEHDRTDGRAHRFAVLGGGFPAHSRRRERRRPAALATGGGDLQ